MHHYYYSLGLDEILGLSPEEILAPEIIIREIRAIRRGNGALTTLGHHRPFRRRRVEN